MKRIVIFCTVLGLGVAMIAAAGLLVEVSYVIRLPMAFSGSLIGAMAAVFANRSSPVAVDPDARVPRISANNSAALYVCGKYQMEPERLRQILRGEVPDMQSAEIIEDYNRIAQIYQTRIDNIRRGIA